MYYLSSENKGADQQRGYSAADLRLCFCMCLYMTRITSLTTAYSIFTSDKRQPKTSAVLIRDRNGVLIANSAGKIAIENAVLTLNDSLSSIVNLTIRASSRENLSSGFRPVPTQTRL